MKVSEIQIMLIKPHDGLVAFASFVIGDALYCGSVGIITRPSGGYRLIYPTKEVAGRQLDIYYPISGTIGRLIEKEVIIKYEEVMNYVGHRYGHIDVLST